jgi:hypothetical protein
VLADQRLQQSVGVGIQGAALAQDQAQRPGLVGDRRIELAKRAGQWRGWSTGVFDLYGEKTVKRYKTFLATWRPAGGLIRVVLVDEPTGWRAFFCTDASASVAEILETIVDRFSLETTFRDCKEIVGAGQQQVRFVWASVGAFHICLWTFTLTEVWAWDRPAEELVDRSASPWDDPLRRPSHADKRRALRRALRPTKSVRFYALGSPRQKFRPRQNGCSAWLHSMKEVPESTAFQKTVTKQLLGVFCSIGKIYIYLFHRSLSRSTVKLPSTMECTEWQWRPTWAQRAFPFTSNRNTRFSLRAFHGSMLSSVEIGHRSVLHH